MKSKTYAKKIFKDWDLANPKEKARLWDQVFPLANAYPQLWNTGKRAPGYLQKVARYYVHRRER